MQPSGLETAFADLQDPRREQGRLHKLIDFIAMFIRAVICGGENWVGIIVDFAQDKEVWLREFLELPNGIPSHDTFARAFQLLDLEELQPGYQKWIHSIQPVLADRDIVPIDGKAMRRSHDRAQKKSAVHLLQAWAVKAGLVLGRRTVAGKSNEILEIPALLNSYL